MNIEVIASGSKGNAYLVDDGQTTILIEAGLRLSQLRHKTGAKVLALEGCICSHSHADHSRGIKDLMGMGIDCYMSAEAADSLAISHHHRCHIVTPLTYFTIGTWRGIIPIETKHDAPGTLGFVLITTRGEKLVYLTDTPYSHYRFKGLSHLMIECNYTQEILAWNAQSGDITKAYKLRVMSNHMSLETVKAFLEAHDLDQLRGIWLLHLSDSNADAERFKREVEELTGVPVTVA